MINLKKTAFLFFLVVSLFSCKEIETTNQQASTKKSIIAIAENYNDFKNTPKDVGILIQRASPLNSSSSSSEGLSVGFYNENSSFTDPIDINGHILNPSNNYFIQNFDDPPVGYGQLSTNLYGLNLNLKFGTEVLDSSLYNAEPIFVYYDTANYPNGIISEGMTFTWNQDLGSRGVIVSVREIIPAGGTGSVSNLKKEMIIEDDGNFTIPVGWLDGYSTGSILDIDFSRGNYKMNVSGDNLSVGFLGMSSCGSTFIKD